MNWTMGRYISELDTEGRDRLIGAPEFNDGAHWWDGECGCLVGTALAIRDNLWAHYGTPAECALGRALVGNASHWPAMGPAYRYPTAVARFGVERVVRAVKLRAARLNGCDPATIAEIVSEKVSA